MIAAYASKSLQFNEADALNNADESGSDFLRAF